MWTAVGPACAAATWEIKLGGVARHRSSVRDRCARSCASVVAAEQLPAAERECCPRASSKSRYFFETNGRLTLLCRRFFFQQPFRNFAHRLVHKSYVTLNIIINNNILLTYKTKITRNYWLILLSEDSGRHDCRTQIILPVTIVVDAIPYCNRGYILQHTGTCHDRGPASFGTGHSAGGRGSDAVLRRLRRPSRCCWRWTVHETRSVPARSTGSGRRLRRWWRWQPVQPPGTDHRPRTVVQDGYGQRCRTRGRRRRRCG